MPRKKLLYINDFPYHVVARSNNRDWFPDLDIVWNIFEEELAHIQEYYFAKIHAFVLMSNHYHLIISTSGEYDLGAVMNVFQTRLSRRINAVRGSLNHVFGGRYRASLILTSRDFLSVLKYLYRNPVKARICSWVEDYPYSTIHVYCDLAKLKFKIEFLENEIFADAIQLAEQKSMIRFLNQFEDDKTNLSIQKALKRTTFRIAAERSSRRQIV